MNLWSEEEDAAVVTFYPIHGRRWEGWKDVLPDRTMRAIEMRAQRLGVAPKREVAMTEGTRRRGDRNHYARSQYDREPPMTPDPNEGLVMRLMADGMTPSEIDDQMHWRPGKSILVLTHKWQRLGQGRR